MPGDVVRLRAGDLIPGDCRLLTARDLFLNEAVLTGESFPAEKSCGVLPEPTPLGQRVNSVFLGTNVISGFATAVVVGTGPETEFGKISERLEHKQPETGFERGLRHFGQLLVKVVLIITVVVFAVKVGWQQKEIVESLIVGLALAVGMTPQLLPAITSVVLAAGAKAMARHQVIVKQLLSIENLGSMTVLCSDKTGTLTDGVVQLQDTLDLAGRPSERVARLRLLERVLSNGVRQPDRPGDPRPPGIRHVRRREAGRNPLRLHPQTAERARGRERPEAAHHQGGAGPGAGVLHAGRDCPTASWWTSPSSGRPSTAVLPR